MKNNGPQSRDESDNAPRSARRFTVGCSAPTDQARPWHVRDRHTGGLVGRWATATDAHAWADALESIEDALGEAA